VSVLLRQGGFQCVCRVGVELRPEDLAIADRHDCPDPLFNLGATRRPTKMALSYGDDFVMADVDCTPEIAPTRQWSITLLPVVAPFSEVLLVSATSLIFDGFKTCRRDEDVVGMKDLVHRREVWLRPRHRRLKGPRYQFDLLLRHRPRSIPQRRAGERRWPITRQREAGPACRSCRSSRPDAARGAPPS
jgi:hypothetical protein